MAIGQRVREMWTAGVLGQLIRFAIAGGIATVVYSAVYLPLATWVLPPRLAVLAVPPAFAVAVTCGFFLHSAWSFRGHGVREEGQRFKFVTVQAFGLLLNALFTWVLTGPMGQAAWVPLLPIVSITPVATFLLNRKWVFA